MTGNSKWLSIMKFIEFDETNAGDYGADTRAILNELRVRYGKVELKQISLDSHAVRIHAMIGGMLTPMATMGPTMQAAAERLMQVMNPPT